MWSVEKKLSMLLRKLGSTTQILVVHKTLNVAQWPETQKKLSKTQKYSFLLYKCEIWLSISEHNARIKKIQDTLATLGSMWKSLPSHIPAKMKFFTSSCKEFYDIAILKKR